MTIDDAFLAAIRADPADDVVRLVYADHLDETSGRPVCPECGGSGQKSVCSHYKWEGLRVPACEKCSGAGELETDGRKEYAEFIRIQIEYHGKVCPFTVYHPEYEPLDDPGVGGGVYITSPLKKTPCGWCRICKARAREELLFGKYHKLWWTSGECVALRPEVIAPGQPFQNWFGVAKGFLNSWHGPIETWYGWERPCPDCVDRPADWETNVVECGRCECTGIIGASGEGPGIVQRHPIEAVYISDVMPVLIEPYWNLFRNNHEPESPWFVPPGIYDFIDWPEVDADFNTTAKAFKTRDGHVPVLSAACLKWAKTVAP